MLFQVSWSIPNNNRVQCWNAFGNMTPDDDLKDAGENIKVVGRWHHLGGTGGVCIAECSDASELNSWMLNWSPICEISVVPVVDDASARKSIQSKPYFSKAEEQNTEDKQVNTEDNSVDESSQTTSALSEDNLRLLNNQSKEEAKDDDNVSVSSSILSEILASKRKNVNDNDSVATSDISLIEENQDKKESEVETNTVASPMLSVDTSSVASSLLSDNLKSEMNEELDKTINTFVSNTLRQGSINIPPLINSQFDNVSTPEKNSKSDDELSLSPESPKRKNTWW